MYLRRLNLSVLESLPDCQVLETDAVVFKSEWPEKSKTHRLHYAAFTENIQKLETWVPVKSSSSWLRPHSFAFSIVSYVSSPICIDIDLSKIQSYGSSRPLSGALQCEGVPWTGDFILARPMWHRTRLFGLIVPEGRKGRKGKTEKKRGPDFPFLPFLMLFLVYVAIGNLLCSISFSSLNVLIIICMSAWRV